MPDGLVLVTGGAGFIGSHLVRRLVQEGNAVRVLDNLSTGRRSNLHSVQGEVELLEEDLRDAGAVRRAVAGARVVYHLAALPSVARSVERPLDSHEVNATGTLRVLLAAREAGARRVVVTSSSSVYGDTDRLPLSEALTPSPRSPYAASKLGAEAHAHAVWASFGLPTVCLRPFNVYGPGQDPGSEYAAVIPRFLQRALAGQPPVIYGDGLQARDFTFVADVVEAFRRAADAPEAPVAGRIFNVGGGTRITIRELADRVCALVECPCGPVHEAARPGEIRVSQADPRAAREALGWQARIGLDEGLAATRDHLSRYARGGP